MGTSIRWKVGKEWFIRFHCFKKRSGLIFSSWSFVIWCSDKKAWKLSVSDSLMESKKCFHKELALNLFKLFLSKDLLSIIISYFFKKLSFVRDDQIEVRFMKLYFYATYIMSNTVRSNFREYLSVGTYRQLYINRGNLVEIWSHQDFEP